MWCWSNPLSYLFFCIKYTTHSLSTSVISIHIGIMANLHIKYAEQTIFKPSHLWQKIFWCLTAHPVKMRFPLYKFNDHRFPARNPKKKLLGYIIYPIFMQTQIIILFVINLITSSYPHPRICWIHAQFSDPFFPECVARVPVLLWGVWGLECVRSTLRPRPQPSATVRNRPQPFATVRARTVWPCLWEVLQRW